MGLKLFLPFSMWITIALIPVFVLILKNISKTWRLHQNQLQVYIYITTVMRLLIRHVAVCRHAGQQITLGEDIRLAKTLCVTRPLNLETSSPIFYHLLSVSFFLSLSKLLFLGYLKVFLMVSYCYLQINWCETPWLAKAVALVMALVIAFFILSTSRVQR